MNAWISALGRNDEIIKTTLPGAFFVWALWVSPATALPGSAPECPPSRIDEYAVVAEVFDGDTLRLSDGRKLRLIGINTPELGRDGEPNDPLARRAQQALIRLAGPGTRLGLRYGRERHDRYGRLLAHLFLTDGTNIQAQLLADGWGAALVVPPNLWQRACYAGRETDARRQRAGIWAVAHYQPRQAASLPPWIRGFHIVRGRVQRVGNSRSAVWLNLSADFAVRIPRKDLIYFTGTDPLALTGKELMVRGWIYKRKGELRMTVRHPASLGLEQVPIPGIDRP